MNKRVRALFEENVYPSFPGLGSGLHRKDNGEYVSDALEDHWQTFQEGVELAVQDCVKVINGGSFLHEQAPTAVFARECSSAINRHFGVEE